MPLHALTLGTEGQAGPSTYVLELNLGGIGNEVETKQTYGLTLYLNNRLQLMRTIKQNKLCNPNKYALCKQTITQLIIIKSEQLRDWFSKRSKQVRKWSFVNTRNATE